MLRFISSGWYGVGGGLLFISSGRCSFMYSAMRESIVMVIVCFSRLV